MRAIAGFRVQVEPGTAGSMEIPVWIFAHGVAPLNKKTRHDPVEGCAIEKLQFGQVHEAFHMARGVIGEKPDFDLPKLGGDNRLRIFLFKLGGR